jgi:ubiquinone/menaquinone biosynthesis C-methylase UbiE
MSFLSAFFYDRCLATAEEACLKEWRQELLVQVSGDVLEIGAGTGANIDFYPETVVRLVMSEPDKNMRKQLHTRLAGSAMENASVTGGSAENIEADTASFDYVVTSLVCCSVTNLETVFLEIRRVLRPDGCLVFLEHVAALEGSSRRRWQNRVTPLWRRLASNCHLNRETEAAMLSAGFIFREIRRESMRKVMPLVRPTIRGIAARD